MHEADDQVCGMDKVLFIAVVLLVSFGLVMVYSASSVMADKMMGSSTYFLVRQSVYAFLGLVLMLVMSRVNYHIFQNGRLIWFLLIASLIGILACHTPLGLTIKGAARWISAGPVTIQPAEAAKVMLVMWLSYSLVKKSPRIKTFSIGFLPHLIIPGIFMMACMTQPDFGTTVVLALLTFSLLFIAGAKLGYIMLAGIVAAPIVWFLIAGSAYRLARVSAFMDPLATRFTTGYQLSQSLFGYAAGGKTGVGLGDGLQKLLFLPEAHNDFIGAIIGEELGVYGIWALLLIIAVVVGRGFVIGIRARDEFGMLIAFGISILFALQSLANLGVSMGLLPTKGLNLPFVSYGGSALLISMTSVGILLNISRRPKMIAIADPLPGGGGADEEEAGKGQGNQRRRTSQNVRSSADHLERGSR
ncbi:MAG: putative lipid II flippase FtsW [Proteobacteria bacterium]|nr:putative lipid II flippase FtsW [Pseudomonadota bacterium]